MTQAEFDHQRLIRELPIWTGPIAIVPLVGGITNRNYIVTDRQRKVVIRIGGDIPEHGIMRFNELAASRAAAAAGLSPAVVFARHGILVLDYIEGHSYRAADVRADRDRCAALIRRTHSELAQYLRGPALAFNVFHIIRDYAHTLVEDHSRFASALPRLLEVSSTLERVVGPSEIVFAHNDLLAANIINDGHRLWLIDWDYAGWNMPIFDLAGLSSNNGFTDADNENLLEKYFETPVTDRLRCQFDAVVCASLLREAMWSMVCEKRSAIEFDYAAYTDENLQRFETAWGRFREREGA